MEFDMHLPNGVLYIKINTFGQMDLEYQRHIDSKPPVHIWNESVLEDGLFGVESCDTLSRIIYCIDHGQPWQDKYYYNELQKTP